MNYEYDIAISYKSEIEEKASKINDYLTEDGWNVFFAPAKQQELLSEKIHQMLYGIYKNKSRMKVLLISDSYLEGDWTSLEKRVSLQSTESNRKRLLIVNYTNQIILPGELQYLQYLDGRRYTEDQIAAFVTERFKKYLMGKEVNGTDREVSGVGNTENGTGDVGNSTECMVKKKNECAGGNSESTVVYNYGIIAGSHAHFGDIHF